MRRVDALLRGGCGVRSVLSEDIAVYHLEIQYHLNSRAYLDPRDDG
jgi:hypothetical protein